MDNLTNKNILFGNEINQASLSEFSHEIALIKQFIELSEKYISNKKVNTILSYESVCYLFAKSIIDYSKMVYDNFVLGHYNSASMIIRTMIENYVCLVLIKKYKKEELWKYYLISSYKSTLKKTHSKNKEIDEMIQYLSIDSEFIEKSVNNIFLIDMKYGWIYKIYKGKYYSFRTLCKLANIKYTDFVLMSDYSHGLDIFLKIDGLLNTEYHVKDIISCIFVELFKLITFYCPEYIDIDFDNLANEILILFKNVKKENDHSSTF